MMKIGIVCEGPSDFPAIVSFVGAALESAGIQAQFRALFPEMDKTRPEGGWANVFNWIKRYPPTARVQRFFAGGLFGGDLATESLDAILFQLDSDILEDGSFKEYVANNFGLSLLRLSEPIDRANQIFMALDKALDLGQITSADAERHVCFPAVESTEAWCVAAFSARPTLSNRLTGGELTTAFMRALEASESKEPRETYANIDKSRTRRERFCELHAANFNRIVRDCEIFESGVGKLAALDASG